MTSIADLQTDVNDEVLWLEIMAYVPPAFTYLVSRRVEPEVAADLVADDGLPVCDDPPDVADDGDPVVVWPTMYEEAA